MNFDQLHEILSEVQNISEAELMKKNELDFSQISSITSSFALKNQRSFDSPSSSSPIKSGKLISVASRENTQLINALVEFLTEKYRNEEDFQEICYQLMTLYNRGGLLRIFALQFLPSVIRTYLLLVSDREKKFLAQFETFLLGIYSQEIMELSHLKQQQILKQLQKQQNNYRTLQPPSVDDMVKKSEKISIPILSEPSIYHHPSNIAQSILTDSSLNRLTAPSSSYINVNSGPSQTSDEHNTVQVGPFPAYLNINSENRFLVLTRLLKTVNTHLAQMHPYIVPKSLCRLATAICRNGFHFPESDLPTKIMGPHRRSAHGPRDVFQTLDDHSSQPRVAGDPDFLLELLNSVYFGLFNGIPWPAIRALDDIRQRSCYELFPDVLLVANAIANSLLENPSGAPKEGPLGIRVAPSNFSIGRGSISESSTSISAEGSRLVQHRGSLVQEGGTSPPLRRTMVTNASLRIKRMPEDIPVREAVDESPENHPDIKRRLVQPFKDVAASAKRLSSGMDLAGVSMTPGKRQTEQVDDTKLRTSSDPAFMMKPSKSDVSIEQHQHQSEKRHHYRKGLHLKLMKPKRLPHQKSVPEDEEGEEEEELGDGEGNVQGYGSSSLLLLNRTESPGQSSMGKGKGVELSDIKMELEKNKVSAQASNSLSYHSCPTGPLTSQKSSHASPPNYFHAARNSAQDLASELRRKLEISAIQEREKTYADGIELVNVRELVNGGMDKRGTLPPLEITNEELDGIETSESSGGYLTPRDSNTPPPRAPASQTVTPTTNENRFSKGIKGELDAVNAMRNGPSTTTPPYATLPYGHTPPPEGYSDMSTPLLEGTANSSDGERTNPVSSRSTRLSDGLRYADSSTDNNLSD